MCRSRTRPRPRGSPNELQQRINSGGSANALRGRFGFNLSLIAKRSIQMQKCPRLRLAWSLTLQRAEIRGESLLTLRDLQVSKAQCPLRFKHRSPRGRA